MLTKRLYLSLVAKHFYKNLNMLYKNFNIVCFVNLSFKLDNKTLMSFQFYIYFFLTIYFSQCPSFIVLKKNYRRLGIEKGFPLGVKLNLMDKSRFYNFIHLFNKWYYYNIFGELKTFFLDKKRGTFFGLKMPFLNLLYTFDYNLITFFLFNVDIPTIKIFIHTSGDKYENISIKNIYGFF